MPHSRFGDIVSGRLLLAASAMVALACADERSGAGPGAADPHALAHGMANAFTTAAVFAACALALAVLTIGRRQARLSSQA